MTATSNVPFDHLSHQPPRIDEFGFNKVYKPKITDDGINALRSEPKLPAGWKDKPDQKIWTNTELSLQRRADNMPHASFDLDGDGHVGDRDYFLAKRFDKDGDGKLNAKEKAEAIAAIKDVSTLLIINHFV